MKKQVLLNAYVNNINMKEAVYAIEDMVINRKKSYVVAVNVDVLIKLENDQYLRKIVNDATMTLVDGQPLVWISHLKKNPVKAKVSGSDLVPQLCAISANKGYSIFIIGGADGVADQAKKNLEKLYPGIHIVGTYAPQFGFEKSDTELKKINTLISEAKPDLLIACLGCPKQEKWIYENYHKYDATVSICAGATVDFLAGNIKRAPKWMSAGGLEWLYRMIQDPKRLMKRYLLDDVKIIKLLFKYK